MRTLEGTWKSSRQYISEEHIELVRDEIDIIVGLLEDELNEHSDVNRLTIHVADDRRTSLESLLGITITRTSFYDSIEARLNEIFFPNFFIHRWTLRPLHNRVDFEIHRYFTNNS